MQLLSLLSYMCMFYSLPSLRPLLDVNYLPLTDMRIARTFCLPTEGRRCICAPPQRYRESLTARRCVTTYRWLCLCVCVCVCVWCVCVCVCARACWWWLLKWNVMLVMDALSSAELSWALLHLGCNFCHTGCHSVLSLPLPFPLCLVMMGIE